MARKEITAQAGCCRAVLRVVVLVPGDLCRGDLLVASGSPGFVPSAPAAACCEAGVRGVRLPRSAWICWCATVPTGPSFLQLNPAWGLLLLS